MRRRGTVTGESSAGAGVASSWQSGLWIVVAAAFAGALGESGLRFASRVLLHRPTPLDPQSVWLGPLLNLAVLAAPMAVVAAVGHAQRRPVRLVFLGVFYASLQVLLLVPPVGIVADAVLALGIASVAARYTARQPSAGVRRARWLSMVLVGASVVLVALTAGGGYLRERHALATLPPISTPKPNVLLVVLDAARAQSMGLYGGPVKTPFLSRLASQCIDYRRAIAPSSWTLPSHASMFTGRWPQNLTADWTVPLDRRFPTLAERLAAHGYATGAAVGNFLYTTYEFGLSRGFAHYDDYPAELSDAGMRSTIGDHIARAWNRIAHDYVVPGRRTAGAIRKDILRWIDARDGRPFFVFLNWYDAHSPYDPPPPWRHAYTTGEPPTRGVVLQTDHLDSAMVDGLRDAYRGSIGYLDSELDSLVRDLGRRDLLRHTVLIVTADHGEEFAEHGYLEHGATLFYPALHVPLLICPPPNDALGGQRVDEPVSLRDIGATILAMAGGTPGVELPGFDLLALARATADDSVRACHSPAISYVRRPPGGGQWYEGSSRTIASIVLGKYHLIRTDQGREELFDLDADPLEQHDLRPMAEFASLRHRLEAAMAHPNECTLPPQGR